MVMVIVVRRAENTTTRAENGFVDEKNFVETKQC